MKTGAKEHYDLIVDGSGPAAIFFLKRWLEHRPDSRVLVCSVASTTRTPGRLNGHGSGAPS